MTGTGTQRRKPPITHRKARRIAAAMDPGGAHVSDGIHESAPDVRAIDEALGVLQA